MAASMRDSPLDGGHRGKVADPNNKTTHSAAAPAPTTAAGAVVSASNFEYDDNEWDIGIGNLIIDLDADIEKTNEKGGVGAAGTVGVGGVPPQQQQAANNNTINNNNNFNSMASTGTGASGGAKGKMSAAAAVEHSATVDKGLKMKIKRTKPGTKEAKHEIVKPPVDGTAGVGVTNNGTPATQNGDSVECVKVGAGSKHPGGTGGSKRGSSGHRRDKARDKHADKQQQPALAKTADVNGVLPATPAVVSGAGGVTGPQTAAVAPASAQQQIPVTPAVAAAPGPTPPLPVSSSQSQVTPPSPASQVQSVPLQPTVPSAGPQPSPVTPSAPPQLVLQQPPAAAADLPPQATTLLVFPTAGSTAPGVCVSVPGGKSVALQQQQSPPQQTPPPSSQDPPCAKSSAGGSVKQCGPEDTGPTLSGGSCTSPPPTKKLKTGPLVNCVGASCATMNGPCDPKTDVTDVCVGTSVGTITEPDCLGPCEPGTSVTLEGIVWHETEGGVLVVNVTWRGKTYVGTLLDCTKHDWAPPRFCDSPTSDLDARTPKGRGKRGRAAAATPANDLSNFTETRSSVHSKLRNGAKGRRGAAGSPAPPTVPSFATPKQDSNNKRKGRASETEETPAPTGIGNGGGGKRSRSGSRGPTVSPPVSPVLLECPEPNCSKKYKHINGLKYHQSHAHGGGEEDSLLDSKDAISLSENDESNAEPPSVPPSPSPEKCSPLPKPEPRKEEAPSMEQLPAVPPQPSSPSQPTTPLPTTVPPTEVSPDKNLVKPGVLRFGPTEDTPSIPPVSHFPVGVYCNTKPVVSSPTSLTNIRAVALTTQTTSPVINIPQPPSVKLLPSSQPIMQPQQQQPSPIQQQQQQQQQAPLSQIPQSPQPPAPTAVTPPSTVQPQDMAANKLCDKYKVKIPPAPQRPAAVQGLTSSPLKAVQSSKPVPLITDLSDKKDKGKIGMVLQSSPQQPPPPQQQPQQLTSPIQQQMVTKKKNRKSPASSPQPEALHNGAMMYGMETSPLALPAPNEGREDVQSPAYSDISDDGAPVLESEVGDKGQPKLDKKVESQPTHNLGHYGMYPFYGQPPYLVPSVPTTTVVPTDKGKEAEKIDSNKALDRSMDKDKKDSMQGSVTSPAEFQQKLMQQQAPPPPQPQQPHYYPYGYVPGYPYNLDSYPMSVMTEKYLQEPPEALERPKSLSDKDKAIKDMKDEKLPGSNMDSQSGKSGNNLTIKDRPIKSESSNLKEKQNENHQILKESIEMKSQMNDKSKFSSYDANQYLYRQQQEDLRRYYSLYPDQQAQAVQAAQAAQAAAVAARRKEPPAQPLDATVNKDKSGNKGMNTLSSPKVSSHKDKPDDKQDKKEQDKPSKQEGVKPTMETQGPPPPTSSYAYIHPSYMQSPHYGALPFDPNHAMYRGINPMLVPQPYGANPYLHPQMRYHGPEDLSRGPPSAPPKALDMLQHHASQYYSSHKIHELQERALKSPTPKSTSTPQPAPPNTGTGPPSSGAVGGSNVGGTGPSGPPTAPGPPTNKPPSADGKDAPAPLRSPPPQRHVHTHHHTHVGLGYPLLPGQYPAPYGGKPLVRP